MKKIIAILLFATSSAFAGNIIIQSGAGTITGVTAGTGISGGGSSGNVTVTNTGVLSISSTSTGGTPITGAAQLLPGSNVTLTQSGQGITIASSGGGSSYYQFFSSASAYFPMIGSNVIVSTVSSVPALAASACYKFEIVTGSNTGVGYTAFLFADSTQIGQVANVGSAGFYQFFEGLYCNGTGTQSAQTFNVMQTEYSSAVTANNGWQASQWAQNLTTIPSSVDWTTTHNITLRISAASGNVRQEYFRIHQ